jgi:hypothetical protein
MNRNNIIILISVFLTAIILTSCEKEEEYRANITVINNSDTIVTDFSYKGYGTDFSKTIDKIIPLEEQEFEIHWIGKKSALFGSIDNSYIFQTIDYYIGNKEFNVQNEKDSKIDSFGNYYSEKEITNGSDVNIVINNDGYEIEYVK